MWLPAIATRSRKLPPDLRKQPREMVSGKTESSLRSGLGTSNEEKGSAYSEAVRSDVDWPGGRNWFKKTLTAAEKPGAL